MGIDFNVFKGSEDGKIVKGSAHRDKLNGDECLVQTTHSGVCGTDEHYRHKSMTLGHEFAGVVKTIGPNVTTLKVGDNVGYGYLHDSCGHCQECLTGRETFCPGRVVYGYGDLDQGSFSSHSIRREAFLFKIPAGVKNEDAAPLMCGGATVFNVLDMYNVRPMDRVGIIGVGGLGHLAIQFASKMGCEVVVFSGTQSKRAEALRLGAKEFYATNGATELKPEKLIDHLLVTTSAQPDWALYLPVMAPSGVIYPLSVSQGDLKVPYMPLIANGLRIQGSLIAPRAIHNRMLEFAAFHGIKPIIQQFPLTVDGITEAMQTLNDGKIRYRGVLVAQN
ncbi:MAG: hypothetical protein M1830_000114 [Pleopsidium flavum]|nr:MAG: hypothetical protein M1830_000114 [Pleopsidium flavum]